MRQDDLHLWQHDHSFGQAKKRPGELRTIIVIAVTATMMVVEVTTGIVFGSMALLTDLDGSAHRRAGRDSRCALVTGLLYTTSGVLLDRQGPGKKFSLQSARASKGTATIALSTCICGRLERVFTRSSWRSLLTTRSHPITTKGHFPNGWVWLTSTSKFTGAFTKTNRTIAMSTSLCRRQSRREFVCDFNEHQAMQ